MKKILLVITMSLLMLTILSADELKALTDIVIDPNPMYDFTKITVSFDSPVEVQISIETEAGKVIKTLYSGMVKDNLQMVWDRIGDNGTYTPSGEYFLIVRFNQRYTSVKRTLILK
ncbi:MAG: hypothetical protein WC179_04695 [Candidatus Cloacimonadaceae bacterium]|nr:hypothetical protein [Candidatus Cloacimonadota bacterium]MDD5625225.1 hypothetical protein [Candidatus Cloacimonadota bacterium]MDY0111598.1 hypothetical protein [Candidatus Syntrophosphaera sp.]